MKVSIKRSISPMLVLAAAPVVFYSSAVDARSCSSEEYDKADYFAEKVGKKIIESYGGGNNERVTLKSCEFNSYSAKFKIRVEVYWSGSMFSSNKYNVDGEITMNEDGSGADFSKTYSSDSVDDLTFTRGLLGGALVLGALAAENGSSSSSGYRLKYTNNCEHPLRLLIRYRDVNGEWVRKGWWTFDEGESSYLSSKNGLLKTKNSVLYYYVESTDDSGIMTDGDYDYSFSGKTYPMRKVTDDDGDTEWSSSCR